MTRVQPKRQVWFWRSILDFTRQSVSYSNTEPEAARGLVLGPYWSAGADERCALLLFAEGLTCLPLAFVLGQSADALLVDLRTGHVITRKKLDGTTMGVDLAQEGQDRTVRQKVTREQLRQAGTLPEVQTHDSSTGKRVDL